MDAQRKPTIPEILARFLAYYRDNPAWGSLHIVLDDGNVDDASVRFCEEYATEKGDHEGAELARILMRMSRTQRAKLARAA
jgi:hypothetical protein